MAIGNTLTVKVEIIDPPEGYRCLLQVGDALVESLDFEISWKGENPVGPMVVRQSDGRRFVYLVWLDSQGGRYGRIKLWADQISSPGAVGRVTVRIPGSDSKGRPACATLKNITRFW
jgi:hypothetical protein